MIRYLAALSLLPMLAGPAAASCYSYGYGYSYPVYKKVYQPYFIPVAKYFEVPIFTAQYVPPVGLTTTTTTTTATLATAATTAAASVTQQRATREDQFRATVVGELRAMRGRLDRIEGKHVLPAPKAQHGPEKAGGTRKAPTAAEGLIVAQNVCGVCHREGASEKDSAGFIMFDKKGEYIPMQAAQMVACVRMIASGKMPKQPNDKGVKPLTDEQGAALQLWLDSLPMQPAKEKADEPVPHRPEYVSIKSVAERPPVRFRRIQR